MRSNVLVCVLSVFSSARSAALRPRQAANPISSQYPDEPTGTFNSTTAIIPISYDLARSIIPSQYAILTTAYQSLLPNFPRDSYPLVIRGGLDHDIEYHSVNALADFQQIKLGYPFVDLLGDGYSSFTYQPVGLISALNLVAIEGASGYGVDVYPATFDPQPAAYGLNGRDTFLTGKTVNSSISLRFSPGKMEYPLSFYVNVTNQPFFGNGNSCDHQVNIYNTTLTNHKRPVVGEVKLQQPFFPENRTFRGIYGLQFDEVFVEYNYQNCSLFKGYRGTGSGD